MWRSCRSVEMVGGYLRRATVGRSSAGDSTLDEETGPGIVRVAGKCECVVSSSNIALVEAWIGGGCRGQHVTHA